MDEPIHIAITRRVRKTHIAEFERALAEFASRSVAEPGARGVHFLHPRPVPFRRSMASCAASPVPLTAMPFTRQLFTRTGWPASSQWWKAKPPTGNWSLEAWFRDPHGPMPARWKMALLTWIAVWPVSVIVPAILAPLLGPNFPKVLAAGTVAAGIVVILTWVAMPLLVKVAHRWLHPSTHPSKNP